MKDEKNEGEAGENIRAVMMGEGRRAEGLR
jgi:hypothetical protein